MVEAKYSRHRLNNLLLYAVVCFVVAGWFAIDGHLRDSFIEEHTVDGVPDATLVFNQKSPPFFVAFGVLFIVRFVLVRKRKVVAGNAGLSVPKVGEISYSSITEVAEGNSSFYITFRSGSDEEIELELSARQYDGVADVASFVSEKVASLSK